MDLYLICIWSISGLVYLYFEEYKTNRKKILQVLSFPLVSIFRSVWAEKTYQTTTHRSEVFPEYEPGGTGGKADTAD